MSQRRSSRERSILIVLLLSGLLGQACSTATGPTDPLERAPSTGEILGLVTGDGEPRAGVRVTLSRSGSEVATVVTTGDGEFAFPDLGAGAYIVAISEIEGMNCTAVLIATVVAGQETKVSFACATPTPAAAVGILEGRVTVNGVGAHGVFVVVEDGPRRIASSRTTSDGSYRFTNVRTGQKTVSISSEDPCTGTQDEQGRRQVAVTVSEGGVAVADFACTGQTIAGRVTVNGMGEPGLRVLLCYGSPVWDFGCVRPFQLTDSDGRYAYTSLYAGSHFPPGEYLIFVETPSGTSCPESPPISVPSGVVVTSDFSCDRTVGTGSVTLLPEELTVGVYETERLTVIVRDMTGAVVADPHVEFFVIGLRPETVDGNGLVTGLPGGCGVGTVIAKSLGVTSNPVHLTIGSPSGEGCWDY